MSVSVHLNGKFFLSSKEAARLSGYTSDYVARLARLKKVNATRVGTQWFVEPKSLEDFLQTADRTRAERSEQLRQERKRERVATPLLDTIDTKIYTKNLADATTKATATVSATAFDLAREGHTAHAHVKALAAVVSGFAIALLIALPHDISRLALPAGISFADVRSFAYGMYHTLSFTTATPVLSRNKKNTESSGEVNVVSGGIVVVPQDTSAVTLEYIRDSFSDEVAVSLDDTGMTGKITPVFKDGAGDPYRFVIVPIEYSPEQSP